MSKFMSKEGFCRKETPFAVKELRKAERWVKEYLKRGATIPEASWCIQGMFQTAFENVRYDLVQQKKKKRK